MMDRLLRRFIPKLSDHLSDGRTASLICGELSFSEKLIAKQHLARCWYCRARKEDLEGRRADQMISLYRQAIENEEVSFPIRPRAELISRLHTQIQGASSRRRWILRLPYIAFPELSAVSRALVTCMVFGFATVIASFFWWQQRVPDISSNALLVRAEQWDTASLVSSKGVVFQAVRITTSNQTMERSIYRDVQGKRRLRQVKLTANEDQIRSTLIQAGLDWDEPISASNYQGWHDRQHIREDKIVRAGSHLLTLTTTVSQGSVSKQSLTVRDTDFHPVRRTIAFRDSRTVEIAEVDFKILPWSDVEGNVFESAARIESAMTMSPAHVLSFPRMPNIVTEGQLDETELGARLILNQLHADTGEQIEIDRNPQEIEVKGLVETDERKRALQAQLRILSHVKISIQSTADLKNNSGSVKSVTSDVPEMASMPDQPSPLETYLLASGHNVSAMNVLSRGLFDSALAIAQESKAISELQTRFVPGEQQTVLASATLLQLIHSHRERLLTALKQERELLAEAQSTPAIADGSSATRSSLIDAAFKNLNLCKELTQTNRSAMRSADKVLAEMSVLVENLTNAACDTYAKPQSDLPLYGKR